jgi:NTE family protein
MSRVRDLSVRHLNEYLLNQADFVFHPDHDSLHWSAFDRTDDFIKNGHDCAKNEIENLIHKLDSFNEVNIEISKETFWTKILILRLLPLGTFRNNSVTRKQFRKTPSLMA